MPLEQLPIENNEEKNKPPHHMPDHQIEELFAPTDAERIAILYAEKGVTDEEKEGIQDEMRVERGEKPLEKTDFETPPSEFFKGMPTTLREREMRIFNDDLWAKVNDERNPLTARQVLEMIPQTEDAEKKAILTYLARKFETARYIKRWF